MKQITVLIVDDEINLAEQLSENLSISGYDAHFITNPENIFATIVEMGPDVIVLDKMMPQRNGIDILKDIRNSEVYSSIPVIVLTAHHTKNDLLQSYKTGADDFISKPFDLDELKVRIDALYTRVSRTKSVLQSNDVLLCTKSCSVKVEGKHIELTLTEFNLLKVLMHNKNEVLRREQLSKDVLGKPYVSSRTLDVHVFSLRNKLKDSSPLIKTIRGVGYKFCA